MLYCMQVLVTTCYRTLRWKLLPRPPSQPSVLPRLPPWDRVEPTPETARCAYVTKFLLLVFFGMLLSLSCGTPEEEETPQQIPFATPTDMPNPTLAPTPEPTKTPRPTPTARASPSLSTRTLPPTPTPTPTATPLPTPTAVPVANQTEARNLVWAYLSQCVSLDLQQLEAVPVREVWLVQIPAGRPQKYGIWKVHSSTGGLEPHNLLARQWQSTIESQCDPEELAALLPPTPTPTPQPTSTPTPTPTPTPGLTPTPTPTPRPTAVLRSTSDAVATLWAYLVGCFPALSTSDLESTLDPPSGEYIVKDRASNVYGVWRVRPDDGSISPDNAQARTKDRGVSAGTC